MKSIFTRLQLNDCGARITHTCTFIIIISCLFFSTQTLGQSANLDQIRNGSATDPTRLFYRTFPNPIWVNGNAGASNAHYVEGMSIGYRSLFTGVAVNSTYEYILEYDTKHSDAMAIDYLTRYQRLQPHEPFGHGDAETLDPRIFVSGSREYLIGMIANTPIRTFTIPRPFQDAGTTPVPGMPQDSYDDLSVEERLMTIINGEILDIQYFQQQALNTNTSSAKTSVRITFTALKDSVVLAWGGHIASRLDWGYTDAPANTIPRSAGGISGSPYHMRHLSMSKVLPLPVQNISLGNQDRSLSAAAVVAPPECPNVASATQCLEAGSFSFAISNADAGTVYTWSFGTNSVGATFSGGGSTATGTSVTVTHATVDNASNNGGSFSLNISAVKNSITKVCTGVATGTVVDVDVAAFVNGNATSSGTPATLNTNQANPTAALTAVIGSEPATLSWLPIAGTNAVAGNLSNAGGTPTGASITFTPTAAGGGGFVAGLYGFEVTATSTVRNVCLATARVYIDAAGTATCPGISGPAVACATPQGNGLSYSADVADPGDNLTYVWSLNPANGATIVGAAGNGEKEDVSSISVNAGTGDFTVVLKIRADNGQVFAPSGCTKSVTVNPIPTCSIAGSDAVCGLSTGNTYTSTVLPAGGTVVHSWSISGDGDIIGATNGASVTVTARASGSFTLTDNITRNGCASSCTKTVTVNPIPTCSIAGSDAVCGLSTGNTYTSTVLPAGGTVVHSWSISGDGDIIGATNGASVTVTARASGSFTLTDNITRNGCASSCTKTVTVNPIPTCSIAGSDAVCGLSTGNTYTSTVLPAGGTVVHNWSISGDGDIIGATNGASVTVTARASGSFTLTDNITRNGCASSCTKTVTVNPIPTCSIAGSDAVCGLSTGNTYTSTVLPAGGTVVHNWSISGDGDIIGATNGASVTVTARASGSFTLTDNITRNECASSCTKTVTVNPIPTCSIAGSELICGNSTGNTYTSTVLPAGGTVVHNWSISGDGEITGATNGASVTVTARASGSFTLTDNITRNGCVSSCTKTVTVRALPTVSAVYNPPACNSRVFTIDVTTEVGNTILVTQPGNPTNPNITAGTPSGGVTRFSGLTAGDGFVVTVNNGIAGCSASTNCAGSTNSCATGNRAAPTTEVTDKVVDKAVVKTIIPTPEVTSARTSESFEIVLDSKTKVMAYPNPFSDKIKFNLMSGVSGRGSLELFNTMGQKVATIFQGDIVAGRAFTKEYSVPVVKRHTLIYVFTVGDQRVSGKLLNINR